MKDKLSLPSKKEHHKLFGSVPPAERIKPVNKEEMNNLQNDKKDFLFSLQAVGISNVKHPIIIQSVLTPAKQTTITTFKLTTSLVQGSKGINMSQLTELLDEYYQNGLPLLLSLLKKFMKELAARMDQHSSEIEVTFPWFFERKGPSS